MKRKREINFDTDLKEELVLFQCVQCGQLLKFVASVGGTKFGACSTPACPNYGLLTVGENKMLEITKEDKHENATRTKSRGR